MSSDVDKARARAGQYADAERRLSERLLAHVVGLPSIEDALGKATLEAEMAGVAVDARVVRQAAYLRTEITSLRAAIAAARRERVSAIKSVWATEADELMEQAARQEAEAAKRQEKTDGLLAKLEAWEGVRYTPACPDGPPLGGKLQGGAPFVVVVPVPKTDHLRQEAVRLRGSATALRGKEPRQWGVVAGYAKDDLVAQIFADPMVIGPGIESVVDWIAEERARQEAKSKRLQHGFQEGWSERDSPILFSIVWANGELDARNCQARRIDGSSVSRPQAAAG